MEAVLSRYDVRLERAGDEFHGKCPLPAHSSTRSKDSFSANFTRNVWSCQSASCIAARSGRVGGNVLDFVAAMEGCSIREAARRLAHSLGENQLPQATPARSNLPSRPEENQPLSFILRNIDQQHPYVRSRGLSAETARYFGVGYYGGNGFLRGRIVIPIHNEQGELIAYSGRATGERGPKYRLPAGFRKSQVLFNLHRVLARDGRTLVLVEGFFDTFKMHQAGYPNVVALMGSRLSDGQAKLILQHFDRIIVMLDGDEAGRAGTTAAVAVLSPFLAVDTVTLASGAQPDELAPEEIRRILAGLAHHLPNPDR
jgi:DNA primase